MKNATEFISQFQGSTSSDEMIEKLLEDVTIRRFVMDFDLSHDTIIQNVNQFLTFLEAKKICHACNGLYECKLQTTGMNPRLRHVRGDVFLTYGKCRYNTYEDSLDNIKTMYLPRKILEADLSDFDLIGDERKAIHQYIMEFFKAFGTDQPKKGMYISGIFGAGKTYILACVANELAKQNIHPIFAYYPDLVRELKSSIGEGNLEDRVEELKNAEVLILDDFGGEAKSAFIRDEVLGPILQFRVLEKKLTFFSSNYKRASLKDSLQYESTQEEKTKAIRIHERIRELTEEFTLSEKPRV
ncbi:MAG: primosomal protein DnaI [Candidatus Izemoplasmatales bacterium]